MSEGRVEGERVHERVRVERSHDGGVAWLVMEKGDGSINVFTANMVDAMTETVERLDDSVGCLVIRGEEEFSAGADLRDVHDTPSEMRPAKIDATAAASNRLIRALRAFDAPVVAAVEGVAAGGGLGFALACDVIVVHEAAALDTAYARIGLTPDNATPFFLAHALGPYRARELLFDPEAIPADEALDLGLANVSFGGDSQAFAEKVGEYAADLARGPTAVHASTKRLVDTAFFNGLDRHLERERDMIKRTSQSETFSEGLEAFLEKREPDW